MDNLLSLINQSGIKQKHLAEKFNVSAEYLSLILNGKRKGKKISKKIQEYLTELLNNGDVGNLDADIVSDRKSTYGIKDKVIINQAEEIYELRNKIEKLKKDLEVLRKQANGVDKGL